MSSCTCSVILASFLCIVLFHATAQYFVLDLLAYVVQVFFFKPLMVHML